jgi:hypothetical protein
MPFGDQATIMLAQLSLAWQVENNADMMGEYSGCCWGSELGSIADFSNAVAIETVVH